MGGDFVVGVEDCFPVFRRQVEVPAVQRFVQVFFTVFDLYADFDVGNCVTVWASLHGKRADRHADIVCGIVLG